MRFKPVLVIPLAAFLSACPPLQGPRLVAPIASSVSADCINSALKSTEGIDWVNHQVLGDGYEAWSYGTSEPRQSRSYDGPRAHTVLHRETEITHQIPHPKYQTDDDHALSENLMQRVADILHQRCGFPQSSAYART